MTDGKLLSGQLLRPEQTLVSVGGHAHLHYQGDGNLVVYLDGVPIWASHTDGKSAHSAKMRQDGNFVISGTEGPIAHSDTQGHAGAMIQLQDDGNFVVYEDPNGPRAGTPIWASASSPLSFDVGNVKPEPEPVHSSPLFGRLYLKGTLFMHDEGPVNPCFAHAGDLFSLYVRDAQRACDEMSKMAAAGYHGARVWTLLDGHYWESKDRHVGPSVTPNYWALWAQFLRDVHGRRLRLVVSQGDIGALGQDMEARCDFAASMAHEAQKVDPFIYAFFDGGNEAWQTGEPDPERLAQFVQAYKDAGGTALLTLTSPPGEEKHELDEFSISPADLYDVHTYRGDHWYDKRRHVFSIPYEGKPNKKNGIGSEGPGNGDLVSVTANKHELNHEAMACLAAASFLGRQAYVWFSGEGVRIQAGLETQQGFEACPRIARLLPADVMSFAIVHHSGKTWANERVLIPPDDVVRVDGASHSDGRFAFVLDGPGGTHSFEVQRGFKGVIIHPATGEQTALEGRAGERVNVSWERGRILVGQKT